MGLADADWYEVLGIGRLRDPSAVGPSTSDAVH